MATFYFASYIAKFFFKSTGTHITYASEHLFYEWKNPSKRLFLYLTKRTIHDLSSLKVFCLETV